MIDATKELRSRLETSGPGKNSDYLRSLLDEPSLDHVRSAKGESVDSVLRFVRVRLGSSRITGHRLDGAEELLRSLLELENVEFLDRFFLVAPDVACQACFKAGSGALLGILVSHRDPGRPSFTERGGLPEWLR
jgi:hypothetical protein